MTSLWIGIAVLTALAVVFLCLPLFLRLRSGELVRDQANIEIYKQQLKDLDADLKAERISKEDHQALTDEVKQNLLQDAESSKSETNHTSGKPLIPIMAFILIVSGVLLYAHLGSENELMIKELLESSMDPNTDMATMRDNADELMQRLTIVVDETPEDVEAWYLLGRIQSDLGRYDEAVFSFSQVLQYLDPEQKADKAAAMAQLAQAQFFANDRVLDKATESLLIDALEINPRDSMVLGLLGIASYENQNYMDAVRYWTRLQGLMPPSDPNRQAIAGGINKAKDNLSPDQLNQLEQERLDAIKASIQVTVNIDDKLKDQLPEQADLFVLAKAEQGPPMPLAVQRLQVSEWPVTVTLDDSMAMMDNLKLSEFETVVITARISKNGVGNAKAGDLEGNSKAISSSSQSATIIIDSIL